MRKIFSLFAALLFAGSMWATDYSSAGSKTWNSKAWTLAIDGGTTSTYSSDQGAHYGTNNNTCNSITITSSAFSSQKIASISVDASRGSNLVGSLSVKVNNTAYTTSNDVALTTSNATYTFSGDQQGNIEIKWTKTSGKGAFYIKKIEITYATAGSVAPPSITPTSGSFRGSVEVTLASTTEGASIYYTTDETKKDTPSTSTWTAYDNANKPSFTETTTIYAAAKKDDSWSTVAYKTFTLYPNELTCADAKTAGLSVSANNALYADGLSFIVEGYVTSTPSYNSDYHNVTFYMADDVNGGEVLQVYRAACATASDAPELGDFVTATGVLSKYGTTAQMQSATYEVTKLPVVLVDKNAFDFGSVEQNQVVAAKTFSLEGNYLTSAVTIAAPSGYTVAPTSITPTAGAIAATDVTVTPITSTVGDFNGNIVISGGGLASNVTIALTMTVAAPVAVTGVELDEDAIELETGATQTLVATISPANATNKAVTWESSDETIATVDENGLVTAVAEGTATITCKSVSDNTKQATCAVTVVKAPLKITITQNELADFTNTYGWYTWTAGGVSGKAYAYKNSGMQFNDGKDGYSIYNTSAIPGKITKITMTKASGSTRTWYAYVSASAMTAADEEGSTDLGFKSVATTTSWDVTGSNSYFYLEVSGGSTVIESIVIEYESVNPTALDNAAVEGKAVKFIENGQLFIEKAGVRYNVMGQIIK